MINPPVSMQCGKILEGGAQCGVAGAHCPVFVVYAPTSTKSDEPIRVQLPLVVCDEHRESAVIGDFLCDEGWAQIVGVVTKAGYAEPERSRTELAWEEVSSKSCEHQPIIRHRSGGDSAELKNFCGVCGRFITKVDGDWIVDCTREAFSGAERIM